MSMLLSTLAASMVRRRHLTLIFHRVVQRQDPMSPTEPTREWFEALLAMLTRYFEVIPLHLALQRSRDRTLSGRTLSITFDDGYADNFSVALPVLEKFNASATFFVASGFLDGGRMWNDSIIEYFRTLPDGDYDSGLESGESFRIDGWSSRRQAASTMITALKHLEPSQRQGRVEALISDAAELPTDLMMSSSQLRTMAASPCAEIGGHTQTHPILCAADAATAKAEIEGGKLSLESIIDRPLQMFAYPNGKYGTDFDDTHQAMVKEAGFNGAVATDWGCLDASTDPYAMPRFTPWHKDQRRFVIDMARCHHGLL